MADEMTTKKRIRAPKTSRQRVAGARASGRHRAKLKDIGVPTSAQIDKALAAYFLRALAANGAKRGTTAGMDELLAKAIEGTGWPADGPAAEAIVARAVRLATASGMKSAGS